MRRASSDSTIPVSVLTDPATAAAIAACGPLGINLTVTNAQLDYQILTAIHNNEPWKGRHIWPEGYLPIGPVIIEGPLNLQYAFPLRITGTVTMRVQRIVAPRGPARVQRARPPRLEKRTQNPGHARSAGLELALESRPKTRISAISRTLTLATPVPNIALKRHGIASNATPSPPMKTDSRCRSTDLVAAMACRS